MLIHMVIAEKNMNIISVYAPQVGCSDDKKLKLWEDIDVVLQSIHDKEGLIVIGYSIGHYCMQIADLNTVQG